MSENFNGDYRNKYEIIQKIGKGIYTQVYKAKNKITNELRAIK